MSFNIDNVVYDMVSAIKQNTETNWKYVRDTAKTYIENKKDRLELLASMRLKNEIDAELFESRLQDEKKIMESELLSLKIISLAIAQKAANAALDVLSSSVKAALKI